MIAILIILFPLYYRLFIVVLQQSQMGECLLLKGSAVYPSKLLKGKYQFKYQFIDKALDDILKA